MIEKDKEEAVFNERNIMTRIDHPFIVKLHHAFQTVQESHWQNNSIGG